LFSTIYLAWWVLRGQRVLVFATIFAHQNFRNPSLLATWVFKEPCRVVSDLERTGVLVECRNPFTGKDVLVNHTIETIRAAGHEPHSVVEDTRARRQ
jgi:hypothetical protein